MRGVSHCASSASMELDCQLAQPWHTRIRPHIIAVVLRRQTNGWTAHSGRRSVQRASDRAGSASAKGWSAEPTELRGLQGEDRAVQGDVFDVALVDRDATLGV